MRRSFVLAVVLGVSTVAPCGAEWVRVESEHFTVLTEVGESTGSSIAGELEQIRALYADGFEADALDPPQPIFVYAVADADGLAALLPEIWENPSRRRPDGLFREGKDKLYIALRLDAPSGRSNTLYHEYFHVLARFHWGVLPLWLDEGMAKVWETARIRDDTVQVGLPNERDLSVLANQPLVPLPLLLEADHDSRLYQDSKSFALFYAQSWAVVHYLQFAEPSGDGPDRLRDFIRLIQTGTSIESAQQEVFGDVESLGRDVAGYVRRGRFPVAVRPAPEVVTKLTTTPLDEAHVLAYRADFLAHGEEPRRAWPWVERALSLDPKLALAHEAAGYMFLAEGRLDDAVGAFAQAASLGSESYLADYYSAAALASGGAVDEALERLRRAVETNPDYTPAHLLIATVAAELEIHIDDGMTAARAVIQQVPRSAQAHQLLGRLLWLAGEDDEALEELRYAATLPTADAAVGPRRRSRLDRARTLRRGASSLRQSHRVEPGGPGSPSRHRHRQLRRRAARRPRSSLTSALRRSRRTTPRSISTWG